MHEDVVHSAKFRVALILFDFRGEGFQGWVVELELVGLHDCLQNMLNRVDLGQFLLHKVVKDFLGLAAAVDREELTRGALALVHGFEVAFGDVRALLVEV